jgi:chromosome segregation ATPase
MNLSTGQAASRRGDNNNSGGGGTLRGAFDAAPANPLTVGAVGFGPAWNDEPSLRELYDTACASIVRAECEADELRAEVAMLKQGMVMLAEERDEERLRVRSLNAFASSLVKTIGELKAERVQYRLKLSDWRDCAKRLVAVVEYYHPDLRDESEGGWSEERAAIGLFDDLERQHQVARDEACRESCRDKAAADGGWGNI